MKTLIARTLEIARKEVGVREVGSNRGRRVEEYLAATGLPGGYAWCSAFVAWCAKKGAVVEKTLCPLVLTADCDVLLAFARKHGILNSAPAPGDVFLVMATPSDAHHTGFVTEVDGNAFETVEGNTNVGGGREGIGVFARKRQAGPRYRFVRWSELVAEPDTPPRLRSSFTWTGRASPRCRRRRESRWPRCVRWERRWACRWPGTRRRRRSGWASANFPARLPCERE